MSCTRRRVFLRSTTSQDRLSALAILSKGTKIGSIINLNDKVINLPLVKKSEWVLCANTIVNHHHHKHQGLDPLIRSVSTVRVARANASSVFQLFSFLVVCSGMISKGFSFVAFFASVKASFVCIHLSCLVCL